VNRYITSVAYRHALLTAYLKVTGRTQIEAERNAKQVGTALHKRMPPAASIGVPRYRGFDRTTKLDIYEIPIGIASCERSGRAEIAKLLLKGVA
jgi:hypothetical protein